MNIIQKVFKRKLQTYSEVQSPYLLHVHHLSACLSLCWLKVWDSTADERDIDILFLIITEGDGQGIRCSSIQWFGASEGKRCNYCNNMRLSLRGSGNHVNL